MQLPNNLSNAVSRVEGQLDDKDWSPHLLQALTTLDTGRWRLSTVVRFAPALVVPSALTWVVCFAAIAVLKHNLTPGLSTPSCIVNQCPLLHSPLLPLERKTCFLAVFTPATDHLLKPTGLQQQGASRALWSSSLAVGLQGINHGCRKTSLSTVTRMPWFTLAFVISASQEGQQDPFLPLAPDGLGTATQSLVFVIIASQEGQQDPSVPLAPDGPGTATWHRAQA